MKIIKNKIENFEEWAQNAICPDCGGEFEINMEDVKGMEKESEANYERYIGSYYRHVMWTPCPCCPKTEYLRGPRAVLIPIPEIVLGEIRRIKKNQEEAENKED